MSWEVDIGGDAFDLKTLSESFTGDAIRIRQVESKFRLEWAELQSLAKPEDVANEASRLLQLITGAARLSLGLRTPLRVDGVARRLPAGNREVFVHLTSEIAVRGMLSATIGNLKGDGTVIHVRPADSLVGWLRLAGSSAAVSLALQLLSSELDWVAMYKLLEIVERDLGGRPRLLDRGWATSNQLTIFDRTANSVAASGDASRHGVEKSDPPSKPMTLEVARTLIKHITTAWLQEKSSNAAAKSATDASNS